MGLEKICQKRGIVLFLCLLVILLIAAGIVWYGNEMGLKRTALAKAEVVTAQVLADRAVYTGQIVQKLERDGTGADQQSEEKRGFIILPAQMVRAVAERVSKDPETNYTYLLTSEWNINPDQGLQDPFDIWAWQRLRRQEAEFKVQGITPGKRGYLWKPIYRFEEKDGILVLRYMRADPASASSCVGCHNMWEKRPEIIESRKRSGQEVGKQWRLHDLMGALSVRIPVE